MSAQSNAVEGAKLLLSGFITDKFSALRSRNSVRGLAADTGNEPCVTLRCDSAQEADFKIHGAQLPAGKARHRGQTADVAVGPSRAITGCEQSQQGSRYSITLSVLHLNRRKRIWTRFNSVALKAIRISSRLPARDVPTWEWTRLGCADGCQSRESLARSSIFLSHDDVGHCRGQPCGPVPGMRSPGPVAAMPEERSPRSGASDRDGDELHRVIRLQPH
jgi:hypothetical protein